MFKKIDHVEIVPSDLENSIEFYIKTLGFTVQSRHKVDMPPLKQVVYLNLGNTVLELLEVENPASVSRENWQVGYRMMAIEIEDMEKAVEYLKSKDVEINWGPIDLRGSKRAEIKDPDGISIELRQW